MFSLLPTKYSLNMQENVGNCHFFSVTEQIISSGFPKCLQMPMAIVHKFALQIIPKNNPIMRITFECHLTALLLTHISRLTRFYRRLHSAQRKTAADSPPKILTMVRQCSFNSDRQLKGPPFHNGKVEIWQNS